MAPQTKAAAQRRLAEQRAAGIVAGMDLEPVTNPIAALQELAAETLQLRRVLLERVAQLQDHLRYSSDQGQEQTRAELGAYERSAERSGRLLTDLAKLGLDSRRVEIEEATALVLLAVITRALADSDLPADKVLVVKANVAKELRRLDDKK